MMKLKEFFDTLEKNNIEVTQKYMKISDSSGTLFALPDIFILGKHYKIDFGYFSDYSCITKLYDTENKKKVNPEDLLKKILTKFKAENYFYEGVNCSCYVSAYGAKKYKVVVKIGTTKSIKHITYRIYFKDQPGKELITQYLQGQISIEQLFEKLKVTPEIIKLCQIYNQT